MGKKNPAVDAYIERAQKWQAETKTLRSVLLGCGLDEELKWGKPCYGHQGSNVAIIQGFKDCCALMFFKGTLLKDPEGKLISQGKHSQAAMRLEYTSTKAIRDGEAVLRAFVDQAIGIEEAGLEVDFKAKHELSYPEELQMRLDANPALSKAFQALTPGRQRHYVMHISEAKQSKTRLARVDKNVERILAGKGLNDR